MENNAILSALSARKSVRVFTPDPVTPDERAAILNAAFQAPTAGNQQLYTILDITDPALKATLADLCDHQPFIAAAPLVLVFLGVEVLWASARRKGEERLRLDFLAAFMSFLLICASLCAATLPAVWRWYGPERSATEQRLSAELEEQLLAAFQGQDVLGCTSWVNLGGYEFDREMTLAGLRAEDQAGVNVTLGGTVENGGEFAARAAALLPALRDAGVDRAYFYWSGEDESWDLDLDGVFDMNADAARLSQMARHQVRVTDESGDALWMDEAEAEEYLAQQATDASSAPEGDGEPAASSVPTDFDLPAAGEETA